MPSTVDRSASAIVYLLGPGQRSHWHRIDAVEVWHLYEGGPLELSISTDGTTVQRAGARRRRGGGTAAAGGGAGRRVAGRETRGR